MDSSSDGFVWSNASDDESDSLKNNVKGDSDSKKLNIKKSLNNEKLQSSDSSSKEFRPKKIKKENSIFEPEKQEGNRIKVESESDFEKKSSSKKKKSKHRDSHNLEPFDTDESFLNLKVKEEQASTYKHLNETCIDKSSIMCESNDTHTDSHTEYSNSQTTKKKKKKKKAKIEDNIESKNEDSIIEHYNDSLSYSKHKKKKQETCEDKNKNESSNFVIEEKFSAEETVVQQPQEKIKKIKKNISNTKANVISKEFVENSDSEHDFSHKSEFIKTLQSRNSVSSGEQYKISDRIQFEDDESFNHDVSHNDMPQSNEHNTSSKLKKFMKANSNLKLVTINVPKEIEIDDEDDIWLIKCPSEFVIDAIETNKIVLGSKSKLKTGSFSYDGYVVENNNNNAILSFRHGNIKISNNCVEKRIAFHRRIPKAHFVKDSQIVNNQNNFIPLPCTKTRHPLFGSNYKKAIKVPNLISDRLKTTEYINKKIRKEKKKKNIEIEKVEPMEEVSEVEVKYRKKKRKYSGVDEVDAVKKKRKIAQESSDAWDSEKAIAENLFKF